MPSEKKAAIYHFTDKSEQRPRIYKSQLRELKLFAESLGFTVAEVFCDMSLRRCEHTEFDRFLSVCNQFDALVTKDFYHISKNTMMCMNIMKTLRGKGLQIYTAENGSFQWDELPYEKPLRVATYTCHFGTPNEMRQVISVRNDIFKLFVAKKTNWTIADQYFDESEYKKDGEQIQLAELVSKKEDYDLLLVHNLNDVHWRTANFCRIRERLQLDIYSLQEGFLKYRKGGQT